MRIHTFLAPIRYAVFLPILLTCVFLCTLRSSEVEAAAETQALERLIIIAPSAPGGGYDLTAQAMKRVLERAGIVKEVTVTGSPGAGGLLGLAELITAHSGNGGVLLVGGMVMMGATASNRAAISLVDATPIARLTGEFDVVAVPVSSPYHTLDDLLEAMRASPGALRWVGGSAGGTDELLMWRLAHAAGVDPHLMHYTALPGGSEVVAQIASGRFAAGISGIIELESLLQRGELRALAVSSPQPLPAVDIPTFDELGVAGLSLMNWRGVFAAPGISREDRRKLEAATEAMVNDRAWRVELARHHWQDAYLSGAPFAAFVAEGQQAARSNPFADGSADARVLPSAMLRRFKWVALSAILVVALSFALHVQKVRSGRREVALRRALHELSGEAQRRTKEMQDMLAGVSSHIEREFDRWHLSAAEREVAHLMLKGLRLKDIAALRNTSGRTVRQQAQAIYRKAGLDGRSDLAAYFLEEFLAPVESRDCLPREELVGLPARAGAGGGPPLKPIA